MSALLVDRWSTESTPHAAAGYVDAPEAARGCRRISANEASCPGGSVERLFVGLGPGDDVFTSRTSLQTTVSGSFGDDAYVGGQLHARDPDRRDG